MVKVSKALEGDYAMVVESDGHRLLADVDPAAGEERFGPDPHAYFDAALAACTAMTVLMVARRKAMPLDDVQVELTHDEGQGHYRMQRRVKLVGALSAEQRDYLLGIANKCPIHRLLEKEITVDTVLVE